MPECVTAHLHVALAQFSGRDAQPFVRFWAFDPKEIIGQSRAELPVDPKDELGLRRPGRARARGQSRVHSSRILVH
jgi:hypothetical protein